MPLAYLIRWQEYYVFIEFLSRPGPRPHRRANTYLIKRKRNKKSGTPRFPVLACRRSMASPTASNYLKKEIRWKASAHTLPGYICLIVSYLHSYASFLLHFALFYIISHYFTWSCNILSYIALFCLSLHHLHHFVLPCIIFAVLPYSAYFTLFCNILHHCNIFYNDPPCLTLFCRTVQYCTLFCIIPHYCALLCIIVPYLSLFCFIFALFCIIQHCFTLFTLFCLILHHFVSLLSYFCLTLPFS